MFGWFRKKKQKPAVTGQKRPMPKSIKPNSVVNKRQTQPQSSIVEFQSIEDFNTKYPDLGNFITHGEKVQFQLAEEVKNKVIVAANGQIATLIASPDASNDPRVISAIVDRLKHNNYLHIRKAYVTRRLFQFLLERRVTKEQIVESSSEAWLLFIQHIEIAAKLDASDVHMCVRDQQGVFLYRVDGDIEKIGGPLPRSTMDEMARSAFNSQSEKGANEGSTLKFTDHQRTAIPVDLSISETQIERAQLRFQFLKARAGWDVVMRLMWTESERKAKREINLTKELIKLGYSNDQANIIRLGVTKASGSVLVAGQTGSGKTTTLYAILSHIASPEKKTYSIEDPVEGQLFNVTQLSIQTSENVSEDEAYEFAIKAVLRADPDIIMVSEMRGKNTGSAYKQCTQSGHLTLSTVHVGSSLGIVDRVSSDEIGVPRDVLCSPDFINVLMYQKLVQQLCNHCKIPLSLLKIVNPTADERKKIDYLRRIGMTDKFLSEIDEIVDVDGVYVRHNNRIADAQGVFTNSGQTYNFPNECPHCRGRGISGRTVCAEVTDPSEELLDLLREGKVAEARRVVRRNVKPMHVADFDGKTAIEHAFWKMGNGLIDPREVESNFEPLEGYLHRTGYSRHKFHDKPESNPEKPILTFDMV